MGILPERPGAINFALLVVLPGTANDGTLLCGVEVKGNERLETSYPGLCIIGSGSGIPHSLSHTSESGVHVARNIVEE